MKAKDRSSSKKRAKKLPATACDAALVCRAAISLVAVTGWLGRHQWSEVGLGERTEGGMQVSVLIREQPSPEMRVFLSASPAAVASILVGLGHELASGHAVTVACYEVVGRDVVVQNPDDPDGETGFDVRARSFEVSPQGEVRPLESAVDDDFVEARGDMYETVRNVLDELLPIVDGETKVEWRGYFERRQAVSGRVAELIAAVMEAGAWSIAPQGDRWMVTITGKAGKRMSVVSSEDLEAIKNATKVAPG